MQYNNPKKMKIIDKIFVVGTLFPVQPRNGRHDHINRFAAVNVRGFEAVNIFTDRDTLFFALPGKAFSAENTAFSADNRGAAEL